MSAATLAASADGDDDPGFRAALDRLQADIDSLRVTQHVPAPWVLTDDEAAGLLGEPDQ